MGLFDIFKKKKEEVLDINEYYKRIISNENNPYGFEEKYANQEEILFKMFGHCDQFLKHIKMIIVTDTHNMLDEDKFREFVRMHPNYDVCFLLGDHSAEDIRKVLKYIDKDKIYGLLGNHDYETLFDEFGIRNINGDMININGVNILGIQGSYRYKPARFPSFSQRESIEFLNSKDKADILVCHDNKFTTENRGNPAHQGLFGITYYLYKNKVPYYIHGHIHEEYRNELINGTKEISSYMYEYIEL